MAFGVSSIAKRILTATCSSFQIQGYHSGLQNPANTEEEDRKELLGWVGLG
jgi:hypothetical protein